MANHLFRAALVCFSSALAFSPSPAGHTRHLLNVSVSDDGSFSVLLDGVAYMESAGTYVYSNGKLYASAGCGKSGASQLSLENITKSIGYDSLGEFESTNMAWRADGVPLSTQIRAYEGGWLAFSQEFPEGLNGTSTGDADEVITSFPSFKLTSADAEDDRGYLCYNGPMVGAEYKIAPWAGAADTMPFGIEGTGPLVLFGKDPKSPAVVFSALSSFMSANHYVDKENGALRYGIMGRVKSLPRGYSMETIAFPGSGINSAMRRWGDALLARYGKDRRRVRDDFTTNYLAYSTDNGAFYYYLTERNKTYQETMIDIKAYAETEGIPYRHWLMDSWWYYKGVGDGVKNWTAMPSIFPDGIHTVYNLTQWPIVAHNRYWSSNTDYAKQNGGEWDFIVETEKALPTSQGFWDYLLREARTWGLRTYEQDWLYNEFRDMDCTLESATLARQWLLQMATAAENNGLTVQYCMSWPRHMLQSVEFQAVTQARVSKDYHPGNDQWRVGVTSIFADAIGVTPTKDNFWSTSTEEGRYGKDFEPYPELQAAVSTLSAGPVAPSDAIGKSDVKLIMRSARADGKLLRPERPARMLDSAIRSVAFASKDTPALGDIWATTSLVSGLPFAQVIAAGSQPHNLTHTELFPCPRSPLRFLAFESSDPFHTIRSFSESEPIALPATNQSTFVLWTLAPVMFNGWTFLGEATSKWVAVSPVRFSQISVSSTGLSIVVSGAPGEAVELAAVNPSGEPSIFTCEIPEAGTIKAVFPDAACVSV